MRINRVDLLKALEAVKPGLSNDEFIEQVTSFAFIKGRVVTYNDEISVSYPIEGLDIEGAIRAEELYALLTKIKPKKEGEPDKIQLKVENNEVQLTIGKRMKAGFTLQSEIKLPLSEEIGNIEDMDWVDLPKDFVEALGWVRVSAAKHALNRPVLTGIHVNKEGFVEASDGYRLSIYRFDALLEIETFVIPNTSLPDVIRFKPTQVTLGNGWVHFQAENKAIISCRLFQDPFPSSNHLLKVKGTSVTLPKDIDEIIDRASIFAQRDSDTLAKIEFKIEEGKVTVHSRMETGGEFEESIPIEYQGEPLSFAVSPFVVQGIFSKGQTFTLASNRLKWEGKNWIYIGARSGEE